MSLAYPRISRLAVPAALCMLASCADRSTARVDPEQVRALSSDRPVPVSDKLDILFVIDDSGSMREEQANLVANFPRFIAVLEAIPGGLPDTHIGVISTNVGAGATTDETCPVDGDNGRLQVAAACRGLLTSDEPFLRSAPRDGGGRDSNVDGDLATAFSCIAELGTDGCGFEQPLEAIRRALDGRNPENDGFLRPDSRLAIIVLTDEDDCSATSDALFAAGADLGPRTSFRCFEYGVTCDQGGRDPGGRDDCRSNEESAYLQPVADTAQFLKDLRGRSDIDDTSIVVGGIYGLDPTTLRPAPVRVGTDPARPTEPALLPVCSIDVGAGGTGSAAPGVRIAELLAAFPDRSHGATICDDSLGEALAFIGEQIARSFPTCIESELADVNPDRDGDQFECAVSYVTTPGTAGQAEVTVPPCTATGGEAPCWQIVIDAATCPQPPSQHLDVRPPAQVVPGTYQRAQCVVTAD